MAQVNRFRDRLALHVGKGETVYFNIKGARELHKAIGKICRSIEREEFADAPSLTVEINERDNGNA